MKKSKLFFALFIFTGTLCLGQNKFSLSGEGLVLFLPKVEGGISYSNVVSAESGNGWGYNILLNYRFNKHLALSFGMQHRYLNFYFTNVGWGIPNWNFDNKMECKNFGIPVLLNIIWPVNEPVSFFLTSGFILGAYSTHAITTYQGIPAMNPDLASGRGAMMTLSSPLTLGFSYKINGHFSVIFRGGFEFLYHGINLNSEDYISGRVIKNLNLGVMYRFGRWG